jgi:hypothetical protein
MGVEQVFTDYFQRAKEYDLAWKQLEKKGKGTKSRFRFTNSG